MTAIPLAQCRLFAGLSENEIEVSLRFFDAREEAFPRGALISRPGEPLRHFGLVLAGIVEVSCSDFNGRLMLMASVEPGLTFGESLSYLERTADLTIRAAADCRILWLSPAKARDPAPASPLEAELCRRFTAMLAERALAQNDRIQILSKPTLRDKIVTFLSQAARRAGSDTVRIALDREGLAAFLGCERSALSRELSRMQKDGLITYRKNLFILHKDEPI